jgi:hypothetical protein
MNDSEAVIGSHLGMHKYQLSVGFNSHDERICGDFGEEREELNLPMKSSLGTSVQSLYYLFTVR